jgi:hypothetical protein
MMSSACACTSSCQVHMDGQNIGVCKQDDATQMPLCRIHAVQHKHLRVCLL